MAEKNQGEGSSGPRTPEEVRKHFHEARQEFRKGIQALLPPEVMEHGRRARKEMLLAWRGLIDAALERLEDKD